MVDLSPEGAVFRNALEERSNQIAMKFQTDGRMLHGQSYDYTVPNQLTLTAFESKGGKPFVFVVELAKSGAATVTAKLNKAISDFDKVS